MPKNFHKTYFRFCAFQCLFSDAKCFSSVLSPLNKQSVCSVNSCSLNSRKMITLSLFRSVNGVSILSFGPAHDQFFKSYLYSLICGYVTLSVLFQVGQILCMTMEKGESTAVIYIFLPFLYVGIVLVINHATLTFRRENL